MRQSALSRNLQVTLLAAAVVFGQDFGTAILPAELAETGTKVLGVMNKTPNASRNLGYSEGPVGDAEGNLYFTEDNSGLGNIWKVNAAGQASNFYNGNGMPNGLEFDNAGKMYSAEKGAVASYDVKTGGSSRTVLSANPALNADYRINDVSIGSNGGVWFTNHANGNQFFYRDPTGKVTKYDNVAPLGVKVPNGIEWIEEKKLLLVCSSDDSKVYRFDVADNGTISNKKDFCAVPVPDGLTVDALGNVYVASYGDGTVYVFDANGAPLKVGGNNANIKVGTGADGNTSNCAFGGTGNKTLFITGNGGAYKVQLKVAGRVRPGSVSLLRRGTLDLRYRAAKPYLAGWTFDGRKVEAKRPAALILTAPIP
jgi:gluconolactonase